MTNEDFKTKCKSRGNQKSLNQVLLARLGIEERQEEIAAYRG
ncbi:MAG: hypothetical protein ACLR6B_16360 [Blautia sp.]